MPQLPVRVRVRVRVGVRVGTQEVGADEGGDVAVENEEQKHHEEKRLIAGLPANLVPT